MPLLLQKLLCKLGLHDYSSNPIIADLDTYWMQGGEACSRGGCRKRRISFKEASNLIEVAYERGKQRIETKYLVIRNREKCD